MNKIPSIKSLQEERYIKENSKEQIFNIVLNKCIEKIIYTNRQTDKTFVIFEVPKILIGYPSYDMKSCILFIINKLSIKNYLVEFIDPFYLYIDWGCNQNQNNFGSTSSSKYNSNEKLHAKANMIHQKFPNADIEFVYEDALKNTSKKNKKNKKKY